MGGGGCALRAGMGCLLLACLINDTEADMAALCLHLLIKRTGYLLYLAVLLAYFYLALLRCFLLLAAHITHGSHWAWCWLAGGLGGIASC